MHLHRRSRVGKRWRWGPVSPGVFWPWILGTSRGPALSPLSCCSGVPQWVVDGRGGIRLVSTIDVADASELFLPHRWGKQHRSPLLGTAATTRGLPVAPCWPPAGRAPPVPTALPCPAQSFLPFPSAGRLQSGNLPYGFLRTRYAACGAVTWAISWSAVPNPNKPG